MHIKLSYEEWKATCVKVPPDVREELKQYHDGVDEIEVVCKQLYEEYLEEDEE